MKKSLSLAAAALAVVSVTACGADEKTATTASTIGATATSSVMAPSTSAATGGDSSPSTSSTAPSSSGGAPKSSTAPSTSAPSANRRSTTAPTKATSAPVVAAAPGARCYTDYRPNGHENWSVYNVRNASCGFAKAVGIAAMQPNVATDDFYVTALSPSGRSIRMHCLIDGGATGFTCSGGNDAVVSVGLNTGF